MFNLRSLYELVVLYFYELLDFESQSKVMLKFFKQHHSDKIKTISMKNLLNRLQNSKFLKVYEDDDDLYLKFNMTKERDFIYNFLPLDRKQQYHLYAAKVLLNITNGSSSPNPTLVYTMGIHFRLANELRHAIVCHFHYGEFLFAMGANKDALVVFQHAQEICCSLFSLVLHDDSGNDDFHKSRTKEALSGLADVDNWAVFFRYSLHDMFTVCEGSNTTLYAILSTIIRYGQTLLTNSNRTLALQIFPLAIQLFVSSRTVNFGLDGQVSNDADPVHSNDVVLYCKNSSERFEFLETTKFLVQESNINVSRNRLKEALIFGIFEEQLESILPSISGYLLAFHELGTY